MHAPVRAQGSRRAHHQTIFVFSLLVAIF